MSLCRCSCFDTSKVEVVAINQQPIPNSIVSRIALNDSDQPTTADIKPISCFNCLHCLNPFKQVVGIEPTSYCFADSHQWPISSLALKLLLQSLVLFLILFFSTLSFCF